MAKYESGKLYKIEGPSGRQCYVGSTIKSLKKRLAKHKNSFKERKKDSKRKLTVYDLFEKYGAENCNIVLLELFPCTTKQELFSREGFWIKQLDSVNRCVPGRTPAEYCKDNIEKIRQNTKAYYEKNKQKIQAYRQANKQHYKEWHKKYNDVNKEKLRKQQKKYASNPTVKAKRNQKQQERRQNQLPVHCSCGGIFTSQHASRHKTSKLHMDYEDSKV
jgi:hypothetical protein